jgi:diguanylate cyclase (GGDEF)-like protein
MHPGRPTQFASTPLRRFLPSVTSFRTRQKLLVMLACTVVVAAAVAAFLAHGLVASTRESRARLAGLGDIVAAQVAGAVAAGDAASAARVLEPFRADPTLLALTVLDARDRVLAGISAPGGVPAEPGTLRPTGTAPPLLELGPRVERPVTRDAVRLGTVVLEQDPAFVSSRLAATAGIGLAILLAALAGGWFLAERFQRVVTGPVAAMAEAMAEVGRTQDFSTRMAEAGMDEMKQLAASFNGMLAEIAERHGALLEQQNSLHQLLNYDPLTRLPNRVLFTDRLDQALARAIRTGLSGAVLFIDLDEFKFINDSQGHAAGDLLLQETARRLASITRSDDTLARLAGDEFTVLLQGIKRAENAMLVARKHGENLRTPFLIDGRHIFISASIGVAMFPEHGQDAETVVRHADTAMYGAKKLGKDTTVLYSPAMSGEVFQPHRSAGGIS